MKAIVFDTGPVISLTTNNLLWLLKELKKRFEGEFYLSEATKRELVDKPLMTKRFEFEALQVMRYIKKGILKVIDNSKLKAKTIELLDLVNTSFKAKGNFINVCHYAEISGIVSCTYLGSDILVIDERTTRLLIENPLELRNILQSKLHTSVSMDRDKLRTFAEQTKNIKLIRSVELVTIAYELGLLDQYLADIPDSKKILLDSVLWGVKISGCAVSEDEIDEIIKIETKKI